MDSSFTKKIYIFLFWLSALTGDASDAGSIVISGPLKPPGGRLGYLTLYLSLIWLLKSQAVSDLLNKRRLIEVLISVQKLKTTNRGIDL